MLNNYINNLKTMSTEVLEVESRTKWDLFDEYGNRQYYTPDEFMERLRVAINNHYGYEVIER